MKKILIINAVVLLFASAAYASGSVSIDLTLSTSTKVGLTLYGSKTDAATVGAAQKLIGRASTGVGVGCKTNALGYAIITQHKQGVKAYATSFDSTAIFMKDAVKGTAILQVPSVADSTDFTEANLWTTM